MELGSVPQNIDEFSPGFHGFSWLDFKNIVFDIPRNNLIF